MANKPQISLFRRRKDQKGATMIEYALLAALISIAAIAVLRLIGPKLVTTFTTILDSL
ncbi:Flp family type IVb pilin [Aquisediminimonas sediminicola]|uniref:Flp family type IVb pilin n=1 Tax=Alteraquisediminimonas sediminicola TaxID=2676787 RepID=UPI001FE92723|nr:Flp family type IVb pilin [Aquisediminimonas sediminicola]